jgi:hypothetical protein
MVMESNDKLKTLVHYICHKCPNPSKLGATKLNKILWFADSIAYKQTGRSISDCEYKKMPRGPVPKSINSVLDELQSSGKLSVEMHKVYSFSQKRFECLSEPEDMSMFSDDDLEFVDQLIAEICNGHTAESISEMSHGIVWNAAGMGEDIPLYAVLAEQEGHLNQDDIKWADNVIRQRLVSAF